MSPPRSDTPRQYRQYKKAELVALATKRRLTVPSGGSKTPHRFDYIVALKDADKNIFRFLDLPAGKFRPTSWGRS